MHAQLSSRARGVHRGMNLHLCPYFMRESREGSGKMARICWSEPSLYSYMINNEISCMLICTFSQVKYIISTDMLFHKGNLICINIS